MVDKEKARAKKESLIQALEDLDRLLVAFSGGLDSTFLLAAAHETLGDRALAATAEGPLYPSWEVRDAVAFAREKGIEHVVFSFRVMDVPEFVSNPPDRCYHCKQALFKTLMDIAGDKGVRHIAHGANVDDLQDYRPGSRAAKEMAVLAPLVDAGLGKEEIRFLSREMGLSTWNKPSMACLASRIPYGDPITKEKLRMIEEAERFLAGCGLRQFRVRHHRDVARIEVNHIDMSR
ncbi:MAG: ATP-dependent sacrificial sulfur transferase LarE, partial [Deltaproteobacteria bacterium]